MAETLRDPRARSRSRRRSARLLTGVLAALAMTTVVVPVASADSRGASHRPTFCVPFSATGQGRDVSDPAEVGVVRTEGTVSVARHPIATTEAAFQITGGTATVLTFAGPLTLRPSSVPGTLTAQLTGSLDLATGPTAATFSAASTSVTGTGPLSRVTGRVAIAGVQNLVDGSFTETLTGELCAPGRGHTVSRLLGQR
jgi:hypothetical protein